MRTTWTRALCARSSRLASTSEDGMQGRTSMLSQKVARARCKALMHSVFMMQIAVQALVQRTLAITLPLVASLVLPLIALPLAASAAEPELKSGVFSPPRIAPDFSLPASDGTELKL